MAGCKQKPKTHAGNRAQQQTLLRPHGCIKTRYLFEKTTAVGRPDAIKVKHTQQHAIYNEILRRDCTQQQQPPQQGCQWEL